MATASISTIGRAVRDRLPERKMTWKKTMRPAGEKFTPDHQVGYFNRMLRLAALVKCQLSVNKKIFAPNQILILVDSNEYVRLI